MERIWSHFSRSEGKKPSIATTLYIVQFFFRKSRCPFHCFNPKQGLLQQQVVFISAYIFIYSPHLVTWYWWAIDMCVLCFAGSCLAELPIQCLICYIEVPGKMDLNASGHMGLCNTYIIDHNSISKNQSHIYIYMCVYVQICKYICIHTLWYIIHPLQHRTPKA